MRLSSGAHLSAGIHEHDAAVRVHDDNGVGHDVEEPAEPLLEVSRLRALITADIRRQSFSRFMVPSRVIDTNQVWQVEGATVNP